MRDIQNNDRNKNTTTYMGARKNRKKLFIQKPYRVDADWYQ